MSWRRTSLWQASRNSSPRTKPGRQPLRRSAELFRQATTKRAWIATNFYWLGAAQFHRMLQLQSLPASRTNALAATAGHGRRLGRADDVGETRPAARREPRVARRADGMKIDGNLLRGARLGPRVAKHRQQALEFGPQNPRVSICWDVPVSHREKAGGAPRGAGFVAGRRKNFHGGSPTHFGALEPRWGHSSCLTFIGRTYELLGRRPEAADYYRRALAAHPADHLAREGLARVSANP